MLQQQAQSNKAAGKIQCTATYCNLRGRAGMRGTVLPPGAHSRCSRWYQNSLKVLSGLKTMLPAWKRWALRPEMLLPSSSSRYLWVHASWRVFL